MNQAAFWALIDRTRDTRDQATSLVKELARLPAAEIIDFDAWFSAYHAAIRRKDLWAAVWTIQGGCSDDGFDYARAWLVGMGERVLLEAVRDPETLARFATSGMRYEELSSVADAAHQKAFDHPLPEHAVSFEVPGLGTWPHDRVSDYEWTAATIRELYPSLYARFLEAAERDRPRGTIDHARFWELISLARASGAGDVATVASALKHQLLAGSDAEAIGFTRWARAYNQALMREGVRDACRVLLGDSDSIVLLGFRGWLIAQGLDVVTAVAGHPDALATLAVDPAAPCDLVRIGPDVCDQKRIPEPDWNDTVEIDRSTWAPDPPRIEHYTAAALRERLPRLTAQRDDAALVGDCDPRTLDDLEREKRALRFYAQAKTAEDPRRGLALLADGLALLPPQVPAKIMGVVLENLTATLLGRRARIHQQLGARDAALADVDLALGYAPRSTSLLELRETIAPQPRAAKPVGPPKRVRHAKFGEGVVISAQGHGADTKLVIDFAEGRKTLLARFVEVLE